MLGVDEQILVGETNKVIMQTLKKRQQRQAYKNRQEAGEPQPIVSETGAEAPVPQAKTEEFQSSGDVFQEKDIVRILITAGGEVYDEAKNMSVAAFILSNIEDVIAEFDNQLYQRVVQITLERLVQKKPVSQQFYLQHTDPEISKLAIDLTASPYEFSENWEKRWEIFLNQKTPEQNFLKDSLQALRRFKLRKIMRMCDKNLKRINELTKAGETEKLVAHLKVQQRLLQMRNELAEKLGTVILKG